MNLKIRVKNYAFWLNVILGAFATALFLVCVNVWNALVDPTTQNGVLGMGDSTNAKSYTVPKKD